MALNSSDVTPAQTALGGTFSFGASPGALQKSRRVPPVSERPSRTTTLLAFAEQRRMGRNVLGAETVWKITQHNERFHADPC